MSATLIVFGLILLAVVSRPRSRGGCYQPTIDVDRRYPPKGDKPPDGEAKS